MIALPVVLPVVLPVIVAEELDMVWGYRLGKIPLAWNSDGSSTVRVAGS